MSVEGRVRDLLASGDVAGAATEAIHGFGPGVLRYLHALLRDEQAAADAFSHFAENLWRGLPSFRSEASLRAWAFRIAFNAALNIRDEAWRRHRRRFATGEASKIAAEVRTKTAVRVERQRQALDKLREALSVEERSLLALRIDQGLSWAEVAEACSAEGERVDATTLMKRFERLKDKLAKMARKEGLVE